MFFKQLSKVAMWRFLFQNFLKSTKFVLFKFHEKAVYFSQLFLFLYAVYDANELLCEEINWNCGFLMRHLQHYLQLVSNMVENIKVLVILIGGLNNCTWKILVPLLPFVNNVNFRNLKLTASCSYLCWTVATGNMSGILHFTLYSGISAL